MAPAPSALDRDGTPAALAAYRRYGLDRFLSHVRQDGRYARASGCNVLTNTLQDRDDHEQAICETLDRAIRAAHRHRILVDLRDAHRHARLMGPALVDKVQAAIDDVERLPAFEPTLLPGMGLARGLNPYTDWTLTQLEDVPQRWVLIVGLDWYPISDLGDCRQWSRCLDPFALSRREDPYWHNTWAWIHGRTLPSGASWGPVDAAEARTFLVERRVGVVFHNVIPYLRPPGVDKSDETWARHELDACHADLVDDLATLRRCLAASAPIAAVCTSERTTGMLLAAGYPPQAVRSWKAHPSRYFSPKRIGLTFREVLDQVGGSPAHA